MGGFAKQGVRAAISNLLDQTDVKTVLNALADELYQRADNYRLTSVVGQTRNDIGYRKMVSLAVRISDLAGGIK